MGFGWEDLWRAEQVHGAELAVVPRGGAEGRPMAEADRIVAGVDGLLTGQAGVLLGIYVADCAAVYLADRRTGAAGLVHSGRQGTEWGIVPRAIGRMGEEFGTRPEDVVAVVSPCIRPPRYEIDRAWADEGRTLYVASLPTEDCEVTPVLSTFIWYPSPERTLTRRPSAEVDSRFGIALYRASDVVAAGERAGSRCLEVQP